MALDGADLAKEAGHTDKLKACKHCNVVLNSDNASKKNAQYWRNECKPCRSKKNTEYQREHREKRKAYINSYVRRIGKVKQYPCITCEKPCFKKYALAFCSDICRFLNYVHKTGNCWIWKGPVDHKGYGQLSFKKIKKMGAHRVSYILFKGEIQDSSCICHTCDNPPCVNPDHLWEGTSQENSQDMVDKGRHPRSKLTKKDVLRIREMVALGVKQSYLVELYKISSGTLSSIIKRRIWKHI